MREHRGLRSILAVASAAALALTTAGPASALVDGAGATVPNTSAADLSAQLAGPPDLVQKLADPFSPANDDPGALAALGSPGNPEDDLGDALDDLAAASSEAAASTAIQRALDILEGNPISGKAYSGLPLLNWNAPAKVRNVPAGGNVEVRAVRFGDHTLTDTWLLDFADPDLPFTITYRVAELGPGGGGGLLAPAPLLADGTTSIGGLHSVIQPLSLDLTATGTQSTSRFHPAAMPETTRMGVQRITVKMPPPRMVRAVLDPVVGPGDGALSAIRPATASRLAAAAAAFGFSGGSPSAAEKSAAIGKIGNGAPEKQIWSDLRGLPAEADPGFLAAAKAVGSGDRQLVAAMRTRTALPAGVAGDPAADVNVVLLNDEAYLSRSNVRLAPGASLKVAVTNADGFDHGFEALDLHNRRAVFGAIDWGQFDWRALGLDAPAVLAPGQSRTYTVTPAGDSFALALGDGDHGEQAGAVLSLDRGPKQESMSFDPSFAAPLHSAQDRNGDVWVTLEGVDKIVRINPAANLADSAFEEYLIPGGSQSLATGAPLFGPHDIQIDGHGIVWATLTLGNGIARIDPSKVVAGKSDGITVLPLEPCEEHMCPPPFPPEPGPPPPPTRAPLQMDLTEDGNGNTVIWFTEEAANRIGAMRVSPSGAALSEAHFGCGCTMPLGIGLDAQGDLWFTEVVENRIGRLRMDQSRPWATSAAHLTHYKIPSGITFIDPAISPHPVTTANPHSIAIDRSGLVWFTEEAMAKVGVLDPSKATPGTTDGMKEIDLRKNDFGRDPAPADIAADRENNVFWVDEYGDMVGSVRLDGTQRSWRPAERQSLTDSPMLDREGNLWFAELGSNLFTRISGVSAGSPVPAAMPVFTASTETGTLTATGLREMTSVDVDVIRAGAVVTRAAGVPLDAQGGFALGGTSRAWDSPGDPALTGGDTVRLTPRGPNAPGAFTYVVADLEATAQADGSVTGKALSGGDALAYHVVIEAAGGSAQASISDLDGSFTAVPAQPLHAGGVVSWSRATPAGIFRTRTSFDPPAPGTAEPVPPSPPGDAPVSPGSGGGDSASGDPKPPASGGTPGGGPNAATPPSCIPTWLSRAGSRARVELLGSSRATVRRCLGSPSRATARRWNYGTGIVVRFRAGRVVSIALRDGSLRSRPGNAGVGSPLAALRRAIGNLAPGAKRGMYRAATAQGGSMAADIRIAVRRGRAVRIRAVLKPVSALDRTGRRLLRSAG